MPLIDLHTHTLLSDGTYTIAELVAKAAGRGVKLLALTDHDTLRGVGEFKKLCRQRGIIPLGGIEISVNYLDENLHLLVYEPRRNLGKLEEYLDEQCRNRRSAAKAAIEQMRSAGFVLAEKKIKGLLAKENVGKPHLAAAFMEEPLNRALLLNQYNFNSTAATISDFIQKFLDKPSQVGFVSRPKAEALAAIKLMRGCGAAVSLAHPELSVPAAKRAKILKALIKAGLDGIEVLRPTMPPEQQKIMRRWVKRYRLLPTAGSDTHGSVHGGAEVGMEVDETLFQRLKRRLVP